MTDTDTMAAVLGDHRCPGLSWDELAANDSRPVPEFLLEDHYRYLGSESIPTARYTSGEFFQNELANMWPNVWQYAARSEDLPDPGNYIVYENVGRSYLVTRQTDGSVRAFHNVCLHRGRILRTEDGHAEDFRCPFHGFTWETDGSLKEIPSRWDFGHLECKDMTLPEAEVAQWGGYIFLRENPGGPTLEQYLAPLPEHFKRWDHTDLRTTAWAGKVVPANWKATAEAFMEAYHVIATHPQLMPFTGDANSKYSIYGDNVNLAITPFGIPSPHLDQDHEAQNIIDAFVKNNNRVVAAGAKISVEDGQSARQAMGNYNRERLSREQGTNLDYLSDAEVQDAFTYNVFPNFSPWGGFGSNVVYRWRPWPDQHHTLMEVRILRRPSPGEDVPLPQMTLLREDQPFSDVLDRLGAVLEQDMRNLPHVQEGMRKSKNGVVELGNYQEVRIRHFHQTLDKYLFG